jgi:hypothetical protein
MRTIGAMPLERTGGDDPILMRWPDRPKNDPETPRVPAPRDPDLRIEAAGSKEIESLREFIHPVKVIAHTA